jgi:MFS family permease
VWLMALAWKLLERAQRCKPKSAGAGYEGTPPPSSDVAVIFLWWTCLRAVFHRGYVLASGLYFVVAAHLSAAHLVLLGTVMSLTLMVSDVPAGVWSDTFSRKWPLVIGHGLLAAGMILTGLVTAFPLLAITQVLWALGWAFSGGADVAWLTDELDRPDRISRVLAARARWDLVGGAVGIVAFGVISWAAGLAAAIVASGAAMALLGGFVAVWFTEDNFTPAPGQRWGAALSIFRRGVGLIRRDREILVALTATMITNGAGMITWLFPRQLVDLGFPADPVLWYTAIGTMSFATGAFALRFVEHCIDGAGAARRTYALACCVGVAGVILLVHAPNAIIGGLGVLLVSGVAFNVTRAVSVIWVNRRSTSDVRATMHSFLSQAETAGEIAGGAGLAAVARSSGISLTLATSAGLIAFVAALVVALAPHVGREGSQGTAD